jgi:hypothetical protein
MDIGCGLAFVAFKCMISVNKTVDTVEGLMEQRHDANAENAIDTASPP